MDRAWHAVSAAKSWLAPNRLMQFAFLDQVVASGGNFSYAILLARALGIFELGRFALAWMLVELIATLQFAAVIQPMLNIGPKQTGANKHGYYGAVLAQQGAACAILGLIVGFGLIFTGWLVSDPTLPALALPLCGAIITYQLYEFFRRYLFACGRPAAGLCIDLLRFVLQLGGILALPFAWPQATAELGLFIIVAACAVAAAYGAYLVGQIEWNPAAFRSILVRHWQFSKWLLPSALLFWTTTQAYMAVAGLMLGAAAAGGLKAASTITGILNLLLLSLNNFAPIQASHAFHVGGPAELRRYISRLAALSATLILGAVAVLNIAPKYIVHLLYGDQYEGVGELVRLLCAPAAVYGIGAVLVIWAAALERTRLVFWSYAIATPFIAVAAFPLVRYWGVTGLVLCSLLVETVRVAVLLVPFLRWSRGGEHENAHVGPVRGNSTA